MLEAAPSPLQAWLDEGTVAFGTKDDKITLVDAATLLPRKVLKLPLNGPPPENEFDLPVRLSEMLPSKCSTSSMTTMRARLACRGGCRPGCRMLLADHRNVQVFFGIRSLPSTARRDLLVAGECVT